MKFSKYLLALFIFFIPYQGLMSLPILPSWRIINVLFVLIATIYIKRIPLIREIKEFLLFVLLFFIFLIIQTLKNILFFKIETYDIIYIISLVFLFLFAIYFYALLHKDLIWVLTILKYSIIFNTCYQIFQIIVWYNGYPELITLLNGEWVHEMGNFARMVNNIFGPSGLMLESGHITLFVGPIIMFLIICDHYAIYKTSFIFYILGAISFILTISGGAFIEGSFILATIAILNYKKIFKLRIIIYSTIIFFAFVYALSFYPKIDEFILEKIDSVFSGNSQRMGGVPDLMTCFYDNISLGLAPKAARYLPGVDPNVFIPSLLADHGLLGSFSFALLYFMPILVSFILSKHKVFIIPFIAMTIHLFLAYGNYTWTFLWIDYMLILWGLNYNNFEKSNR